MKTVVLFSSKHHGNTRKLLEAMQAADANLALVDVQGAADADYSDFDRVGLASGVYAGKPDRTLLAYAERDLPEGKPVFFVLTSSMCSDGFFKPFAALAIQKGCTELGRFQCMGYNTFGPFKLVSGVGKGHPTDEDLANAVTFYQGLPG